MVKRVRLWDFKFELASGSKLPVFMQIVQKIIEEIQAGRLAPSSPMPSTRQLALNLSVNRKTVIMAYEELIAQGWLSATMRSQTFVSPNLPSSSGTPSFPPTMKTVAESASTNIARFITQQADVLYFGDGMPDTRLIPSNVIARAFRHSLLHSSKNNCLAYGDPKGIYALRSSISEMLNMERGLYVTTDNICIVRGSQMGIFLAARVLVKPEDNVVVESLTYPPARDALQSCGANILTVGLDEFGLRVDELEEICRKTTIRAVYVTPHHQFPTTVTMTAERRLKLLMLADKYDFYIIEDDYDHEFHFTNHPILPLASNDKQHRVLYVGSLSKVLAPALRVGYLVASSALIERYSQEILLIDRQGNSVTEQTVSELINTGELRHHIRKTFKIYSERRRTLEGLINEHLAEHVDFKMPVGGLAFWILLKDGEKMQSLLKRAIIEKVGLLPAANFSTEKLNLAAFRLGFGHLNLEEITEGIMRLKKALDAVRANI
ncbi:PLP-dependent aminotransferase family protein [Methylobacillus gramineus]|uniref:MocR-like pyridoxine biosynthesis transcription factor PdxR n=1 Tax=Methylobacillus gramineus TaxID=755169 RepID=UPI001D0008E7|nr:PLP-dependent aminotransferase family protein [Methylobacillus gramineus]MCB5184926.1 PLP-dependent aminotransferase family protein [Methylobacillus gramineus]